MPRDFLFASWEGGGNAPPMLTLVRRLVERGHRVRVLGDSSMRQSIQSAGAAFEPWRVAPCRPDASASSDPMRDWEATDGPDVLRRIVDRLMCGTASLYAADVLEALERREADALVTSEMLLGPMIAAEARGVPVAALACNIPIVPLAGVPPFGPGFPPARTEDDRRLHAAVAGETEAVFAEGLPALNAARAQLGLAPIRGVFEQLERLDRYLVATAQAFDFPAERLPENLRYVGPLMDEPVWARAGGAPEAGARPRVVVAFSTTFQDQGAVLSRIIEALARLPVDGVVTTGPNIAPTALPSFEHVKVLAAAPHDQLMRGVAAVVTHAGHGTTVRALLAGAPLLCMPMGRDQNDNAARVTERGAGLRLAPEATVEEIRVNLNRLLNEPAFREAAGRLGAAIAAETNPDTGAVELEALAATANAPNGLRCAAEALEPQS